MKIRRGFVSNSSSSSFILSYQKSKVIEDPEKMVEYFKEHPNSHVVFYGKDWGEGEDIFEMSYSQKALVRKFPEDFINTIKGTNCKICVDATLAYDNVEGAFREADIEVPGMEVPEEVTLEEYGKYYRDRENAPAELKERVRKRHDYEEKRYRIYQEELAKKEEEFLENERKALVDRGVFEEDAIAERVWVSNGSCNEDFSELTDFAERYVANTVDNECDYILCNRGEEKPYILFYDELIGDKEEIIKWLRGTHNSQCNFLFWSNPIFNMAKDEETDYYDIRGIDIDFYEIGPEELKIIEKKLPTNERKVYLATNAQISVGSQGISPTSSNFKLGFGRPAVIRAGMDLVDFKNNFED